MKERLKGKEPAFPIVKEFKYIGVCITNNVGKRDVTARIKRTAEIALEKAKGIRRVCAGKLQRLAFFGT